MRVRVCVCVCVFACVRHQRARAELRTATNQPSRRRTASSSCSSAQKAKEVGFGLLTARALLMQHLQSSKAQLLLLPSAKICPTGRSVFLTWG